VFVLEGEYKAISLVQAGLYAVSYPNATTFPEEWADLFLGAESIVHVLDTDAAGELSAERLRKALAVTRQVRLPNAPKGDAQDFLLLNGIEAFISVVNSQKTAPHNDVLRRLLTGELHVPRIPQVA
jgi:DNA primase